MGRVDGWTSVQSLVRYYAEMVAAGRREMAQQVLHTLHDFAFAEVLDTMRSYSRAANDLLDPAIRDVFDRHPEL